MCCQLHQGRVLCRRTVEAVGLEPTNGLCRRLFSRQVPHPAGWLPFVQSSSGGWNRTNGLLVQSQASLPTATTPDHLVSLTQFLRKGSGSRYRTRVSWFKARRPTISRSPIGRSAMRESNPPRQVGSLAPLPLGQGHTMEGGRRGSRTLKAVTLDRFRGGCHRQLACPSVRLRRQESNLRRDA